MTMEFMTRVAGMRLSGMLQKEIAAALGLTQARINQILNKCREAGIDVPRKKQSARAKAATGPVNGKLPPNMPSRKIPRCSDCQMMLSDEGTCIDCPGDSRRMLQLLALQRSHEGTLNEVDETLEPGLLKDFKRGLRTFEKKMKGHANAV